MKDDQRQNPQNSIPGTEEAEQRKEGRELKSTLEFPTRRPGWVVNQLNQDRCPGGGSDLEVRAGGY